VYAISTNTGAFFGSSEQARGDKTLKKFAEDTGGRPFFPFKIEDLAVSFQDIGEELRVQYQIGYRPNNTKMDGTFRRIRIDVANKNFKAKARNGYYAPRSAASQQ
jgi:VWFA-related protein